MIPQDGQNNGGIWNSFERYARDLAFRQDCESVEILSGPIYPKNSPYSKEAANPDAKSFNSVLKVLKLDGAPVPEKIYKIIKCNSKNGSHYSAYEFLNEATEDNERTLGSFEVSLEDIEKQTGLRFNLFGKPLK